MAITGDDLSRGFSFKQQAHRIVINYKPEEVLSARRAAGLAINLDGPEANSQTEIASATTAAESAAKTPAPMALTEPRECAATES